LSIVQSSAESQPNRRIMLISLLIETVRPYKKCSLEEIREHFAEKSIWFCYSYQGETRMKSKLGALYMQIASSSEKIFSLWFEIEKKIPILIIFYDSRYEMTFYSWIYKKPIVPLLKN